MSSRRSLVEISDYDLETGNDCQQFIADTSPSQSWCAYSAGNQFYFVYTWCNQFTYSWYDVGFTWNVIEQMDSFYDVTNHLGMGLNNNFVLFALLCVNVATITFIIWGINLSEVNNDKQHQITSVLSVVEMLLITTFLSVFDGVLSGCYYYYGSNVPSIFHLTAFVLCTIVCTQWSHYCSPFRCRKFKYFVFIFTFIVPFIIFII